MPMKGAGTLVRVVLTVALGLAAAGVVGIAAIAWLYASQFGGESTFIVANRTTVPVAVPVSGSTFVVPPCSERTIGWNTRWGADAQGRPVTEPVPSGAWVLPEQFVPLEPFEGAAHAQVVISDRGVVRDGNTQVDCRGIPPGSEESPDVNPLA